VTHYATAALLDPADPCAPQRRTQRSGRGGYPSGMDGVLTLRDGRALAHHRWGPDSGRPVLWLQGIPISRLSHPGLDVLEELQIQAVTADRPGFGGSTPLPGHGLATVADDLAQLLDHLELDQVPVVGGSGGGPFVFALAAGHAQRIQAATVFAGAAPWTEQDLAHMGKFNAESWTRYQQGGRPALLEFLTSARDAILADPEAGFDAAMATAPDSDRAVLADPNFRTMMADAMREALRPGAEGWADEAIAAWLEPWDIDTQTLDMPIVWWHAAHDTNVPLTAAQRFTATLPRVDLRIWPSGGHLEWYHHQTEILTDTLARADHDPQA
jgi:pimeloyl-ACP methyl ester carboxylesterase